MRIFRLITLIAVLGIFAPVSLLPPHPVYAKDILLAPDEDTFWCSILKGGIIYWLDKLAADINQKTVTYQDCMKRLIDINNSIMSFATECPITFPTVSAEIASKVTALEQKCGTMGGGGQPYDPPTSSPPVYYA